MPSITDFKADLEYFLCKSNIRSRYDEKICKIINTYDDSGILDPDNYLTETESHVNAKYTIEDKWLDIGSKPQYCSEYEQIFADDIDKYKVFLFIYVLKKNMSDYWIYENDNFISGMDTQKMRTRYAQYETYFNKKYISTAVPVHTTNIVVNIQDFDTLYDSAHPVIKRVSKPQTVADKEQNKLYNRNLFKKN
eukprot:SAG11_NODE_2054_length_3878_cov_1.867161_7_plen_193_part_00